MNHSYFKSTDFFNLTPPYLPPSSGPSDTSHVDTLFRTQPLIDTPVKDLHITFETFDNFTFIHPFNED